MTVSAASPYQPPLPEPPEKPHVIVLPSGMPVMSEAAHETKPGLMARGNRTYA